jgi:hypothetical protein
MCSDIKDVNWALSSASSAYVLAKFCKGATVGGGDDANEWRWSDTTGLALWWGQDK